VNGNSPNTNLLLDSSGNLYGATEWGGTSGNCGSLGCGTVFELSPGSGGWTQSVLYNFGSDSNDGDGINPTGLIFDQAGNLYGTAGVGVNGGGIVFELSPHPDGSWTQQVLYSFCSLSNCADGSSPGGLVLDASGNLFGTTYAGGADGAGTAFQLTQAGGSWTEKVLHDFQNNGKDGYNPSPSATLILDGAGNLYGTTQYGGAFGSKAYGGTVFKLAPNGDGSWSENILHSFCSMAGCRDGEAPAAGLIFDRAGRLYGTTMWGGAHVVPFGTVFRLAPKPQGEWKEQVLYEFTGGEDGAYPVAGLAFDGGGKVLYGVTVWGGNPSDCSGGNGIGCGVVFRLTLTNSQWVETTLHEFVGNQGHSYTGLISDPTRHLFGTTIGNGKTTLGSVFKVTP
jgi:uncharacterized repeat protein (TIGR03803 family)